MSDANSYVFAGGGTGGHLFPGLAVADALRKIQPDAKICFLTTTRDLDRRLLAPTPYEQITQTVRPMPARPTGWPGFLWNWRKSVALARRVFQQRRPAAVLGLGGYAAGPAVIAAHKTGVRTAILNPDAIPGQANKRLARHADLVVLQWDSSRRHFASSTPCEPLGCPVRADFTDVAAGPAREHFGLQPDRPTVVVTGASQGARTINQAMTRVWPEFAAEHGDWQLLHLSGAADEASTREAYRACCPAAVVRDFTSDMHLALSAADIVVSRSGASTLAELTLLGKPSILLPYPYHRDRHQHANGQVLTDVGAAVMLEDMRDAEANRRPLLAALHKLASDERCRAAMADAARGLGRPNAANDVARRLSCV